MVHVPKYADDGGPDRLLLCHIHHLIRRNQRYGARIIRVRILQDEKWRKPLQTVTSLSILLAYSTRGLLIITPEAKGAGSADGYIQ